jgi:hypothetical protein
MFLGPGIYYGDLIFGSQNPGDSVMTDSNLLPYHISPGEGDGTTPVPISLVLTEFHFILLYTHKIQAISTLSKEIVWEVPLTKVNFLFIPKSIMFIKFNFLKSFAEFVD